jgi:hypothetical protein
MKGLLVLLFIAGAGYLAYDDYTNREALKQTRAQIGQLQLQLQQQGRVQYVPRVPSTPAPPTWFQQHLKQGTSLDPSRPHDRP